MTESRLPVQVSSRSAREWNAAVYHQVSTPQVAWGQRVLARLELTGDEVALDAGCGTGLLTEDLLARLPAGHVIALDRSHNMLEVAREHLPAGGRVGFVQADLLALPFTEFADVVFSTATFHWVLDHSRLFANLFHCLRPGGWLVAQCGGAGNLTRMHHRAKALTREPEWRAAFTRWEEPWEFASAETTARRLAAGGFVNIETDLEDAPTPFESADAFATFVTNVVLRPFLVRIDGEPRQRAFVSRLVEAAGRDDPPWLLDYVRLNIKAQKPNP